MSRTLLAVLLLMLVAACGGDSSADTAPAVGEADLEAFCAVVEVSADLGRQELMTALVPVAPSEIADAVRRASQLNGSMEDDAAIDAYLARCD